MRPSRRRALERRVHRLGAFGDECGVRQVFRARTDAGAAFHEQQPEPRFGVLGELEPLVDQRVDLGGLRSHRKGAPAQGHRSRGREPDLRPFVGRQRRPVGRFDRPPVRLDRERTLEARLVIQAQRGQDAGPLRVRRRMPQRRLVELDRLVDGVATVSARAGEELVANRACPDPLAIGRVGPGLRVGLLDRQEEVFADQPGQLGLRVVRDPLEPCPDRCVRPGSVRLRHRSVGCVAQEGVLEAQFDLAREARRRTREDEAPLGEPS